MRLAKDKSVVHRRQLQWWLLGVALLVLGAFLVFIHAGESRRALATESDRLRVQVNVIAEDMERNLMATNVAIDGVKRDFLLGPTPDNDGTRAPQVMSRRLRALVEASAGVRGMAALSRDGTMVAANRLELVGQDFSRRDYFSAVRDKPDASVLYLSAPFNAVGSPALITGVSRMVPGADNSFSGVIVATLDPVYFASVLRPAAYSPDVWAMVVHGDGVQLTNFPLVPNTDGTDLNRPGSFFRRHLDTGQNANVLTGAIYTTGEQRMMALRTVQPQDLHMNKPLVVGVSRSMAAIMLPLQRQAVIYGSFYAVVALLCCGGLYFAQKRFARLQAMTAQSDQLRLDAAERVQLALYGANLGLWEIDLVSGNWLCDDTMCAQVGSTQQELQGTPAQWRARMHPDDRGPSTTAFKACVEGAAPFYDFTYRIRHSDGHWVWILARARVTEHDAQGKALRIMGTNLDVTASKNAEAQVAQARNELQAVFDNMTEALYVSERSGRLVRVNPAGRNMLGLFDSSVPLEEGISRVELVTMQGDVLPADRWPRERALRGDFVHDYEMQIRRTDTGQAVYTECNTAPIYDAAGELELVIFAIRDVTERRTAVALRQARDLAESANRSKAEFLANMSHEIRTPLNVILGLAYLLEKLHLSRDAHEMVQKIRASGRSLLGIINDILDVSKIESGRMDLEHTPFRLSDVIENVANTMGMAAGNKNIELIVNPLPPEVNASWAMRFCLEQVLVNLTSNAIKFTSVGQVVLKVDLLDTHDERMTLRFSVKDSGIGIAPDMQSHVFAAFSQADTSTTRRFGGTGLGLTICRQLVELMGGEIGLESAVGKGSEFWFRLELQTYANGGFSSPDMVKINALVADDSNIARDAVIATARGLGWHVEAVDSGEAALSKVLSMLEGRLPDVVVLDWKMPGMDGMAAARAIRAAAPVDACPVVIMATAYSVSALANEPGADLVDAILSKPVTTSALYNAVIEARRHRASVTGKSQQTVDTESRELMGLRLLVVDDSEINCEVAKRILEEHGATVSLAFDGGAALEWLMEHPDDVDLVLLDVQMPVLDGIEVTRRLRRMPHFRDLPIVALTAGAFKSQQEAAREAGMTEFVGKPFDVPMTVALIQRLTRAQPDRASMARQVPPQPRLAAQPDTPAPERVVLDVTQGLSTWGNLDTYREYLNRFVVSYCDAAETLATHLSNGDNAAAAALAHKLAGVAANMAFPNLPAGIGGGNAC